MADFLQLHGQTERDQNSRLQYFSVNQSIFFKFSLKLEVHPYDFPYGSWQEPTEPHSDGGGMNMWFIQQI